MGYRLAGNTGDTLAVPQLVLTHLRQTDGDTIRAALYILQTRDTDPRTMARALALPSIETAKRALQYWAGAGLLVNERGAAPAPAEPVHVDLASAINDPYVAVLCQEAQNAFGKTLSRSELQRLVDLYLADGWKPDVILLCCAEVTRIGRRTVAAVAHLLARWREDGVENGEDAERWLKRAKQREDWCADAAAQFGVEPRALTNWERRAIARWHEEMGIGHEMIEDCRALGLGRFQEPVFQLCTDSTSGFHGSPPQQHAAAKSQRLPERLRGRHENVLRSQRKDPHSNADAVRSEQLPSVATHKQAQCQ